MAKLNLMAAALLTAAMPLVASCAPAGSSEPGAAALTPKQTERLDKQLAGKVPGEPMRCLPSYRTNQTIRVSDNILLYRAGGNLVYRNDLKSSCPGLARDSDPPTNRLYRPRNPPCPWFAKKSTSALTSMPGAVMCAPTR